jgi:hypothetical protein
MAAAPTAKPISIPTGPDVAMAPAAFDTLEGAVDDEAVDDEAVDDEAVDDEAVDDETVDAETADCPADSLAPDALETKVLGVLESLEELTIAVVRDAGVVMVGEADLVAPDVDADRTAVVEDATEPNPGR